MRGKLPSISSGNDLTRITPAGAGKTKTPTSAVLLARDHPRRCGENCAGCAVQRLPVGSPPQVRGKQFNTLRKTVTDGITPAGAGKTESELPQEQSPWDHPRRCGENFSAFVILLLLSGSPPQVRGKQSVTNALSRRQRITPAGAGKTSHAAYKCRKAQDHPRRCGENTKKIL